MSGPCIGGQTEATAVPCSFSLFIFHLHSSDHELVGGSGIQSRQPSFYTRSHVENYAMSALSLSHSTRVFFFMACKHANLMHGIVSMCAEVTSHSAPRSAGGSRSKWTSRWSGRRAAPRRRWRRGRQWSPRRGLPRPGQGQSSPANTKNRKLRNELVVLCFPSPKPKIRSPLTSRNHPLTVAT